MDENGINICFIICLLEFIIYFLTYSWSLYLHAVHLTQPTWIKTKCVFYRLKFGLFNNFALPRPGVITTISKLTKMCVLRLTPDNLFFVLSGKVANGGVSMWCELSQVRALVPSMFHLLGNKTQWRDADRLERRDVNSQRNIGMEASLRHLMRY